MDLAAGVVGAVAAGQRSGADLPGRSARTVADRRSRSGVDPQWPAGRRAIQVSGVRVVEGLLLGGILGVGLGTVVGLSRWAEATVDPPMQMLRALPHLGLIPLFILWFGIGELPKVLLVALGVSFPLYLNTFSAIRQVDPKLFETADVLGFSFRQRLSHIIMPSAAPQVLVAFDSPWPSPG